MITPHDIPGAIPVIQHGVINPKEIEQNLTEMIIGDVTVRETIAFTLPAKGRDLAMNDIGMLTKIFHDKKIISEADPGMLARFALFKLINEYKKVLEDNLVAIEKELKV